MTSPRILNSLQHFFGHDATYVHSPIRNCLELMYPEHMHTLYVVQAHTGPRYVIRIEKDTPDFEQEQI